jgi:DNA mismatch repair protein MutL
VHDFVRDSLRAALVKARPAAGFLAALDAQPTASPSLMPPGTSPIPGAPRSAPLPPADSDSSAVATLESNAEPFHLTPVVPAPVPGNLPFDIQALQILAPAASEPCSPNGSASHSDREGADRAVADPAAAAAVVEAEQAASTLNQLGSLKPIGQLRESFILASGEDGLWIIDQHVAHERILFEKILRDRHVEHIQRQRLLMPLLVELKPEQMVVFARIAQELENNGFEVEPFGPQTLAVKAAPVGLEGGELERALAEVIDQSTGDSDEPLRHEELTRLRTRIAASIACHSAIKVNTTLDPKRIEWLLLELAKTSHPTSCPHGRPIALLYSWKEIQRAFHRI